MTIMEILVLVRRVIQHVQPVMETMLTNVHPEMTKMQNFKQIQVFDNARLDLMIMMEMIIHHVSNELHNELDVQELQMMIADNDM